MACKISGEKYAMMYGPTVGDKVRLADTNLVVEVEKDYTIYGDEVKFGGGKTIRDGMGQSVNTTSADGDLDLVITNALIIDYTGIIKADIGIKNGKIVGIGKAGNPDVMDGVTPNMTIGASTEALAGENLIVRRLRRCPVTGFRPGTGSKELQPSGFPLLHQRSGLCRGV